MKFLTREQVRALDRIAIEELGIAGTTLMENAGRGAAAVARSLLAKRRGARVVVVAGTGNNGGDGFVVARHLARAGHRVRVLVQGEPRTDDARAMLKKIRANRRIAIARATEPFGEADLVVDAVFGTGLDREVGGEPKKLLERIGAHAAPVLALDVPSGLDANTGSPLGVAVRAVATATFAAPKSGLVVTPGIGYAGAVHVVSIGTPADLVLRTGWDGELTDADRVRALVPPRPAAGHKGTFGHLLVVGGSPGKTGAALLAAEGALRAGAGLVTIAARGDAAAALDAKVVEAMTAALPWSAPEAAPRVLELAAARDALVVGPGLGTDPDAAALVLSLVSATSRPLILDADALTALASDPARLRERAAPTILTPHPGELARLVGGTAAEVQADRIGAARRAAKETGAIVVLKGARTIVARPSGEIAVNPTGGPALATGGTGDVLAGVVGSLVAQGLGAFDAARLAVYVHGLAGDLLAEGGIDRGHLAREVAGALPAAFRRLVSLSD
jgi:NAD(P)H-hydrate epimerase